MIAVNPQIRAEIVSDMQNAIRILSQSVGIKQQQYPQQSHLLDPNGAAAAAAAEAEPEVLLEGSLVAAILQTTKGQKLMGRSFNLLEPEKR
jgi:hypothetical protein